MIAPLTLKPGKYSPRRNLPKEVSRKRGETNFVCAFERAYLELVDTPGITGHEFAVPGYGIADFIRIEYPSTMCNPGEMRDSELRGQRLTAFEFKLKDWRQGFQQAFRYSYFADQSILVLPVSVVSNAKVSLHLFFDLGIGLWAFNSSTGIIQQIFTPQVAHARNQNARNLAFNLISRNLNLSELAE